MNSATHKVHRTSPKHEQDRRRHQRVDVQLLGRFMLEDQREYPCQTQNVSPGSIAIVTPVVGRYGERVVAYIDVIGRVEGKIVRILKDGFAMSIDATVRKKDQLAAKLMWLANRHELDLPEDRRDDRIAAVTPSTIVTLPDGREYRARIVDASLSGLALKIDVKPPIGSVLNAGRIRARVARHLEDGIAVEFTTRQTATSIAENL
jgi:hypothetical protein